MLENQHTLVITPSDRRASGQTPSGFNDTDVSGVGVTIWGCTLVVEVRRGLESVAAGHMWIYCF